MCEDHNLKKKIISVHKYCSQKIGKKLYLGCFQKMGKQNIGFILIEQWLFKTKYFFLDKLVSFLL